MKIYKIPYVACDKEWSERVDTHKLTPQEANELGLRNSANVTETGITLRLGWVYDFQDELSRFVVNTRYYGWREYYATNKTAIRKELGAYHVREIVAL